MIDYEFSDKLTNGDVLKLCAEIHDAKADLNRKAAYTAELRRELASMELEAHEAREHIEDLVRQLGEKL